MTQHATKEKCVAGVKSTVERGCDDLHVSCEPLQIIITNHNATTTFAKEILKKCNANKKCEVPNHRHECVQIHYTCNEEGSDVDITEMSHVRHVGKYSLLSLMSNGYRKGHYAKAHNTQCSLIPKELKENVSRHIDVVINEFAPYANSTGLCFNIEDSEVQPFCSGSRKIYTPFHWLISSTTGWHFGLTVSNQIKGVPEFRFWIQISVYPNDGSTYYLECHPPKIEVVVVIASIGTVLIIWILAILGLKWWTTKRSHSRRCNVDEVSAENLHSNIDESSNPTASIPMTQTLEVTVEDHDYSEIEEQPLYRLPDPVPLPCTNDVDQNSPWLRALPSIPTASISTIQTADSLTHLTPNQNELTGPPRSALGSGDIEAILDQQSAIPENSTENEVDIVNDKWNKVDELLEEIIDDEYEGLDKATVEADKISRHSDETQYTALDGNPRSEGSLEVGAVGGLLLNSINAYLKVTSDIMTRLDALEKKELKGITKASAEVYEAAEETYGNAAGHRVLKFNESHNKPPPNSV